MISMKKNPELFWLLEALLLTPVALFWIGVVSMTMIGESNTFNIVIGQPFSMLKISLVTILFPIISAFFAFKYLAENKKEKGAIAKIAKYIIAISITSFILVIIYLYGQSRLQ